MSTTIKCPNCSHEFAMEEAVSEQYKKDLREQMIVFTRKKEDEFQKKALDLSKQLLDQEEVFQKKLNEEKKLIQQSLEENLRKTIHNDFETPVFEAYPTLQKIKQRLYADGALYASMTGSGSTIFGIFNKSDLPEIEIENAVQTRVNR